MIRRKKIEVLLWKNKYQIYEPDVWLYLLSLEDFEQFLINIFQDSWEKMPKLSDVEIIKLTTELFEVEITDDILSKYKKNNDSKIMIDDFIVTLWKFVKYFWINYEDVWKLPFSFFQKTIKNLWKISWNEEQTGDKNWEPEKQKLKNLLSNFS